MLQGPCGLVPSEMWTRRPACRPARARHCEVYEAPDAGSSRQTRSQPSTKSKAANAIYDGRCPIWARRSSGGHHADLKLRPARSSAAPCSCSKLFRTAGSENAKWSDHVLGGFIGRGPRRRSSRQGAIGSMRGVRLVTLPRRGRSHQGRAAFLERGFAIEARRGFAAPSQGTPVQGWLPAWSAGQNGASWVRRHKGCIRSTTCGPRSARREKNGPHDCEG